MDRKFADLPPFELTSPVLAKRLPTGPQWVHEIKHDGHRCAALLSDGEVLLVSRSHRDVTAQFPVVAAALEPLRDHDAVIDGEIGCQDQNGVARLDLLHEAIKRGDQRCMVYFAFDLLYLDSVDLRPQPLLSRKECLCDLLAPLAGSRVVYCDHLEGDPSQLFDRVCALRGEGIISKVRTAPYRGGRDPSWLKVKCRGWAAEHAKTVEKWNIVKRPRTRR
jgi:bifunctional non-homologous end joining protein LigD